MFQNLENRNNWSLQLLNIKTSKRTGTEYSSRQITLSPTERLVILTDDISAVYTVNGKKSLDSYRKVREYDGAADSLTIYKFSTEHELIASEYSIFIKAIADSNNESNPFEYTSAYLLKGQIVLDGENTPIKLISMLNPVTTLKHKFLKNKGIFKELSDKVLSLRPTMDVFIVDEMVYFLTLAGEIFSIWLGHIRRFASKKLLLSSKQELLANLKCLKL